MTTLQGGSTTGDQLDHPDRSRFDVLGVAVDAVNLSTAAATIESWVDRRRSKYVCVRDVNGVMASYDDPDLKEIHAQAGLVVPDGMPLVWIGRLRGHRSVGRVYGPDLMLMLCERSVERGSRHFLYGGGPGVPQRLGERLMDKFPGLNIVGTHSPPFRELTEKEDRDVVAMINDTQPDYLWVGLSTPKQERWMHKHAGRVNAPVMLGVGAAFDFHAGTKCQAPSWMGRLGLEWSFRLITEPRRLGPRYLRNNPRFMYLMARSMLAS